MYVCIFGFHIFCIKKVLVLTDFGQPMPGLIFKYKMQKG